VQTTKWGIKVTDSTKMDLPLGSQTIKLWNANRKLIFRFHIWISLQQSVNMDLWHFKEMIQHLPGFFINRPVLAYPV